MTTPNFPGVNNPSSITNNTTPPAVPATVPNLSANTAVGSGSNAQDWAEGILTALGAPVNTANVNSMIAWFEAEDNNGAQGANASGVGANNPLDVTPSSGSFGGTTGTEPSGAGAGHPGNFDFSTPGNGIAATAAVINKYPAIASALKSGAGLIGNSSVSSELSTWSGNGYSSLKTPSNANLSALQGIGTTGSGGGNTVPTTLLGSLGIDQVLSSASALLKDVATVLDYVFGMFGRGQGWRFVFTLITIVAAFGSYKCLASAGMVPDVHAPAVIPV